VTPVYRWNFACRAYSNLGMLKISFGLFPLARYFSKRLQKMYGLGEPTRYLNMLYPHFQKESCSFDVGQAVMSSRTKCDKRHISFLTSIYRGGATQKVCSFCPPPLYSAKTRHVRRLLRCTPCFRDGSIRTDRIRARPFYNRKPLKADMVFRPQGQGACSSSSVTEEYDHARQ
jgi:hypothetical protein